MTIDPSIRLVTTALSQWGQSELAGEACNPVIGDYLKSVGLPANDETSWCSAFMYWCAAMQGLARPPLKDAPSARSWLKVGATSPTPAMGDVVVLSRPGAQPWSGHVGIYIAHSSNRALVHVLGGNQSNLVGISPYSASRVLGYRRLSVLNIVPPEIKQ
jgi:uncharacterized protein (TIGR02594 family)